MRALLRACLLLSLPAATQAALPGNAAEGKSLHDIYCSGCHDTSVYTRNERNILSLQALEQRLRACERAAGTDFSATERQDVLKYLNDRFYRFP